MYSISINHLPLGLISLGAYVNLLPDEQITNFMSITKTVSVIFITRNGLIKKSNLEEYNTKRNQRVRKAKR